MRLDGVTVLNFRLLRKLDVGLQPATVVVGPNDSGKSTLLDAIEWVFNWRRETSATAPHDARQYGSWLEDGETETVIAVIVRCSELGPRRTSVFRHLLDEGTIRFGRVVGMGKDRWDEAAPYVIAPVDAWRRQAAEAIADPAEPQLEHERDAESLFAHYENSSLRMGDDLWMPRTTLVGEHWSSPRPTEDDLPSARDVVRLHGPDQVTGAADFIRPIVRAQLARELGDAEERRRRETEHVLAQLLDRPPVAKPARTAADDVIEAADRALERTAEAWGVSARKQLGRPVSLEFNTDPYSRLDVIVEAAIGDLQALLDEQPMQSQGSGTRRSLLMAALDLYSDPDLWPSDASVLYLVEEPEVGLDPAAQRRVAEALRTLIGHGVQSIVVTHSPIFVNAALPSAIRIAQVEGEGADRAATISEAAYLEDVARSLEAKPSDVLLARRFVVVEGESDAAILSIWANEMGFDLRSSGVHAIDAGGYTMADAVAKFIQVAYRDVPISVLLDNGSDTNKKAMELVATYGERVTVTLLPTTDIEGCFAPSAVETWLDRKGVDLTTETLQDLHKRLVGGPRKRNLDAIARKYLQRRYDVKKDGMAIAAAMSEDEIPNPVKSFLMTLTASTAE